MDNGHVYNDCACTPGQHVTKYSRTTSTTPLPISEQCYTPTGHNCLWFRDCLNYKYSCDGTDYKELLELELTFTSKKETEIQNTTDSTFSSKKETEIQNVPGKTTPSSQEEQKHSHVGIMGIGVFVGVFVVAVCVMGFARWVRLNRPRDLRYFILTED
ncbi:uncharacterized protein LOC143074184 [Mytilus galloprovincialis]|uniref:uncharacterized protein LOC143074184 n=1 Tax=Mytilus galloprovincialis TaxID=29158 RepID=UPI003F7C2D5E